ncbi:NAD(P)/FAD-dependent oxidoreductase [Roseivivax sp.]
MRRLYEPAAYGPAPGCFWAEGVAPPDWPSLAGAHQTDVAVIGGGYTGLTAGLSLAEAGTDCLLLEAEAPGWGASGRNGGFCCLGGAKAPEALLRRRFGAEGLAEWHATQAASIETVAGLIARHGITCDTHSRGETQLAHNPRAARGFEAEARATEAAYGVTPEILPAEALPGAGLGGGFHGALTTPLGFALHPRKYHHGLARAATKAGLRAFGSSPVITLTRDGAGWRLDTPHGQVRAKSVLIATNGYSSEDLPDWLAGRTLPVQSSIILTRPLEAAEAEAQGWHSDQMCYDSRELLHYFRRLPDGRFLFGMRGGLHATPRAQARIARKIRRDFARLFPAWSHVEITHEWSGLVCLMANLTPFAGPVPEHPGLFAALGYHGNGVAMASHLGREVARKILSPETTLPRAVAAPPRRFPLGRFRRALLAPAYLAAETLGL